jgi:hypothetical protein
MRSPARLTGQERDYRTEDSDPPRKVERRTRLRFPFELRVRFRSVGEVYPVAGAGWVRNISSGGVLVMYQHEVRLGTTLELHIDWPTRLEGRIPLQLVATGTVVRRELFSFALGLERYHFRIAGKQDPPGDESFGAGA